ncbi:MAG: hypothetical protein HDR01_07690 [Lachnospiraceae bacterium]|nr:hypothetical protein [Lachnospiraceae bacterium]
MKKYLVLLGTVVMLFLFYPMEASALGNGATLWISDKKVVFSGKVENKVIQDGKGGTATYDEVNNTLTLNNFHLTESESSCIAFGNMGEDFQIILKGENVLSSNNNAILSYDGLTLRGPGKLTAMKPIVTMETKEDKFVVRDCELEITSNGGGIACGVLDVQDADINIISNARVDSVIQECLGIRAEVLIVKEANISVSIKEPGFLSLLVRKSYTDGSSAPLSESIILYGDEKVMDEEGHSLHVEEYKYLNGTFYVYTDKTHEEYIKDKKGSLAKTVKILSAKRTAVTDPIKKVNELINAIGTVTQNSGEAIKKAKTAYLALTDYQKQLVYSYSVLEKAEKEYEAINQAAADEVINLIDSIGKITNDSKDEIEKIEKEYDKLTADQKSRIANYADWLKAKADYEDLVQKELIKLAQQQYKKENPKLFYVNVTELKSVSSKKKGQVTLTWKTDKKCTGYQIQYSTDKKFKKNKAYKYITSYKKKKVTLKKLKSKNKYYFRIREYKVIGGIKYFGKWSIIKSTYIK